MSNLKYLSLPHMLETLVQPPQRRGCRQLLVDHGERFREAPGSAHNHQAWPGGYWDHVTEVMNLCVQQYNMLHATGRLADLPLAEQFSLSDALVVLFVHDLEKPWRYLWANGQLVVDEKLRTKTARKAFVQMMLNKYQLRLKPTQANALTYVEGIRDEDYRPGDRIMEPLAALVHTCDLLSARLFYNFPMASHDTWAPGRTTP
jgi:hypothetical protein